MSDSNTVRVLSIDGGGMRGYISTNFMELFVQQWGINPNQIWKYFDVITGSSIGGIQALGYSLGIAPSEINSFFTVDGPWIFTTNASTIAEVSDLWVSDTGRMVRQMNKYRERYCPM